MKRFILIICLLSLAIPCYAVKNVNYDVATSEQMTLRFNVPSGSNYIPILATMTGKACVDDNIGEAIISSSIEIGTVDATPATYSEIANLLTMNSLQTLYTDWYLTAINEIIQLEE
jgi:hypothetical protein